MVTKRKPLQRLRQLAISEELLLRLPRYRELLAMIWVKDKRGHWDYFGRADMTDAQSAELDELETEFRAALGLQVWEPVLFSPCLPTLKDLRDMDEHRRAGWTKVDELETALVGAYNELAA